MSQHLQLSTLRPGPAVPAGLKRVVLVSNCAESVGGIKTFMGILADWLVSRGVAVELVSLNPPSAEFREDPRLSYFSMRVGRKWTRYASAPSPGLRGRVKAGVRILTHPLVYPWVQRRYLQHFNEYGPDTVVIFTQVFAATALKKGGWVPLNSVHAVRPRIVGQWHSSYEGALRYPIVDEHRQTFEFVDRFLLLTREDADRFGIAGCRNVGVMPNPIDEEPLRLERQRRAVTVCRFYPEKQLDVMVRAFARATQELPGWTLELYGYGHCEAAMRREITAAQAGDRIFVRGVTDKPAEVFASSMLHLQTSLYEGFPYAILEAACQSTPTAAFVCSPGVDELVPPDAGYRVPPQNEEAMADAIKAALCDETDLLERGQRAAVHAQNYSSGVVLGKWADLLQDLYSDHSQKTNINANPSTGR